MSGVRLLSSWFFDALAPACLLGSGLFLASASISRQAAGNHGAWLGAWAAVSAVVLLAVLRQRLPSLPILGSWCAPPLWLAAGLLGAALLGKQAVEGLSLAAADLALSSSRLPGLDLAECLLLGSLLVLLLPSLLLGRLSVGLLPLRLLSLLGLALLLVGAVSAALRGSFASVPNPSLPEMDRRMILSLAALSWSVPALAAGFDWSGRVRLKRALVIGLGGALSMLLLPLLAVCLRLPGLARPGDLVLLSELGRKGLGRWGSEVGAGLETGCCLLAAAALVVLCFRLTNRVWTRLPTLVCPVMLLGVVLLQSRVSTETLTLCAAVTGWLAVVGSGWPTVRPGASTETS